MVYSNKTDQLRSVKLKSSMSRSLTQIQACVAPKVSNWFISYCQNIKTNISLTHRLNMIELSKPSIFIFMFEETAINFGQDCIMIQILYLSVFWPHRASYRNMGGMDKYLHNIHCWIPEMVEYQFVSGKCYRTHFIWNMNRVWALFT